jgi:L-threonylcarbamoyladenylate synthase
MKNQEIVKAIKAGKIFIYPTDTVYGLGCDALNKKSVERIKEIKSRDRDKPLSVIAPSLKWIYEHCNIHENIEKYVPGAYTLILEKHNPSFLSHVSPSSTLGIRIPDCEFLKIIQKAGVPFITTSVNLSGEKPATKISEISEQLKQQVDFIIPADEGKMTGKPSTLIINGEFRERK